MGLIILDPGVMPDKIIRRLICTLNGKLKLITDVSRSKNWTNNDILHDSFYSYPSLDLKEGEQVIAPVNSDFPWLEILNDHQTFLLLDRQSKKLFPRSNTLTVSDILVLASKSYQFLNELRPEFIVYTFVPHEINRWVFSRVAEILGITVLHFYNTPMPWRYFLFQGIKRNPTIVKPKRANFESFEYELWHELKCIKRGNPKRALPIYEQHSLRNNGGFKFNLRREIRDFWFRPDLIYNKWRCMKSYKKIAKLPSPHKSYVIFYLHYQPEATTLPSGFGFAQQLSAIMLLSQSLPSDVELYVKEHPSTLTNITDPKHRQPDWYDKVTSVPGVSLLPIDADPYLLMDDALAVVTIAGTVAFEALIRGTPAIVLGMTAHIEFPGLHIYKDQFSLNNFLKNCYNIKWTENELDAYFRALCASSYRCDYNPSQLSFYDDNFTLVRYETIETALVDFVDSR